MGVNNVEALEARPTMEQPQESGTANLWVGGFGKDVNVWGWCGNLIYLISFTEKYKVIIQTFRSRITLVLVFCSKRLLIIDYRRYKYS